MSFVQSFFLAAALLQAPSKAQLLGNWDLNFMSLDTDFSLTGTDELVLHYEVGKDRVHQIDLFDRGCAYPIEGINVTYVDAKSPKDDTHDLLDIFIDVERSNIATSNLWNPFNNKFELCMRLQLLSGDMVIKKDMRDIAIAFDFSVDFTADAVALGSISRSSGIGSTKVDSFVEACRCSSIETFECDNTMLFPSMELYLCVKSASPDIEIDSLHSLVLSQDNFQGSQSVLVVDGDTIQDPTISAKFVVPEHNGVAVAMLVPAAFWKYGGTTSVSLSGTVFLRLAGSRRLAVGLPSFDTDRILRSEESTAHESNGEAVDDDVSAFQVRVGLAQLQYDSETRNPGSGLCVTFSFAILILAALLVI